MQFSEWIKVYENTILYKKREIITDYINRIIIFKDNFNNDIVFDNKK